MASIVAMRAILLLVAALLGVAQLPTACHGLSASPSSNSNSKVTAAATAGSARQKPIATNTTSSSAFTRDSTKQRSASSGGNGGRSMTAWVSTKDKITARNKNENENYKSNNKAPRTTNDRRGNGNSRRRNKDDDDDDGVQPIRRRRESLQKGNQPLLSLNLNLDAMAMSGSAPRAQELMTRIHALYQEGYYDVAPDTVSYNSVLKAWKESGNPEMALELLQRSLQRQENSSTVEEDGLDVAKSIQANVISFNTVIWAFAQQGKSEQALDLLRQMERQRDPRLKPNTLSYNGALRALAQAHKPAEAEGLLRQMVQQSTTQPHVTPDTLSFNALLLAYANAAGTNDKDRSYRETTSSSNDVSNNLVGYAAAKRAQQILERMERMADSRESDSDTPNSYDVVPDVYSYTKVINAWARCDHPLQAQSVLESMVARGLEPNRYTYTTIMSSLAKSGRPDKAQALLYDMTAAYQISGTSKPDTVAYSSVIDGWARISHVDQPHAAQHAVDLLKQMEEVGAEPNAFTYCSVLTAIAKSGTWDACEKARALLYAMPPGMATSFHYNAVLNAYARSPRADKALKAFGLLQEMVGHVQPACRPDMISYNSCLMACANAFGNSELKTRSHAIAVVVFKMALRSEGMNSESRFTRPTSSTFAHFSKATRRLVGDTQVQKELLRKTFTNCCRHGCVNKVTLQQIRLSSRSDDEWAMLVGAQAASLTSFRDKSPDGGVSNLPREWTHNGGR